MANLYFVLLLCFMVESNVVAIPIDINSTQTAVYKVITAPTPSNKCRVFASDPLMNSRVQEQLDMKVKLINYILTMDNYTVNPLEAHKMYAYLPSKWARVSSSHGQTLLSLAFNHGLLSLFTLTFGVETLTADIYDEPRGCLLAINETEKISIIMDLLLRDFKPDGEPTLEDAERICHEIIMPQNGQAKFTDHCCFIDSLEGQVTCVDDIKNVWLYVLYTLLTAVKFGILFCGPVLFIDPVKATLCKQNVPYIVKLKTPLVRTLYLCKADMPIKVTHNRLLDLRKARGFSKFAKCVEDLPLCRAIKVKFTEYNVLVSYKKLLTENYVPVGLIHNIQSYIFNCKIREIGPFEQCCKANMFGLCTSKRVIPWISFWKNLGRFLVVILLPTPYYIRLMIFYKFEYTEVLKRKDQIAKLNLTEIYTGSLLHYLTPTHPVFITLYIIYFFTAAFVAFVAKSSKSKLRKILVGSFTDLEKLSWINAVRMSVSNLIWPFKRFGVVGCFISIVYWPIALPLSILICLMYTVPSIYIVFRMAFHSKDSLLGRVRSRVSKSDKFRTNKRVDKTLTSFDASTLFSQKKDDDAESVGFYKYVSKRERLRTLFGQVFAAFLCILALFSVLLVFSEVLGFIVEAVVFTTMGLVINAGSVFKYAILFILVTLYSYDCFNNMSKRYLKLNKSLFTEVKGRIKEVDEVTSLPSHLQENFGFKSQSLDEQGEYEESDDLSKTIKRHWLINDLVLFIDNEDMPRIPRQLFDEVCQIKVAGAPGPVYMGLIMATKEFLLIVCFLAFVFIIIMSFSEVYQISSTNQSMATMAGGFLPFLMKNFLAPNKPDVELGTVSFKSKLDEIIKNFKQTWPVLDFPVELWTQEDDDKLKEAEGENEKDESKNDADEDKNKRCDQDQTEVGTGVNIGMKSDETCTNNNAGDSETPLNGDLYDTNDIDPNTVELKSILKPSVSMEKPADVDYVVILPQHRGNWLNEWTDLEAYGKSSGSYYSEGDDAGSNIIEDI